MCRDSRSSDEASVVRVTSKVNSSNSTAKAPYEPPLFTAMSSTIEAISFPIDIPSGGPSRSSPLVDKVAITFQVIRLCDSSSLGK